MNLKALAGNIRRLRNIKRYSQNDLAEAAGISLPSIKKIEYAMHEPRLNTVQEIARALGVGIQDLFLPVRELKTVRFRSSKAMKNREVILTDAARWLDNFNSLEEVLDEKIPFRLKDVIYQNNEIVKCAALCRKKLGIKETEAIRDICGLLEYAGVKVYPLPMASDGFFGLSIGEDDGGPAVVVNTWERVGVERQIFSAAHELGHLILHREAFDVSKTEEDKVQEKEADSFAGHFLMPDEGFLQEWKDAAGLHPVDRVLKVKRMFRVSYKAVLHRLIEKRLADDTIWKKFNFAFHRKFNRPLGHKEEPYPMERFDFAEDRFSGLVRKAVEGEKISLSRGAEIFRVGISEMRDITNQWKSAL